MNARDEAKARVRAKVAAEKALPASEQLMNTLHATRTTADSKALLAAYRTEVLAEELAEVDAAIVAENDRALWATKPGKHWAADLVRRHRAKVLAEAALIVVASCPDHQPADAQGAWMDCHCPVADEFRRMAATDGAEQREPIALPFAHTDGAGAHLTVDQIDIGDDHPAVSITATLMPEQVTVVVLADEVDDVIAAITAAKRGA